MQQKVHHGISWGRQFRCSVKFQVELGAQGGVDHAAAELDDDAADQARVDAEIEVDLGLRDVLERRLDVLEHRVGGLLGQPHLGPHDALRRADELAVGPDHVRQGEEPAVGGREADEVAGQPADPGLRQHGLDRLDLVLGREGRAAHEAPQVGALGQQGVEPVEPLGHRVDGPLVAGELEQRRGVPPGDARQGRTRFRCVLSHQRSLFMSWPDGSGRIAPVEEGAAAARPRTRPGGCRRRSRTREPVSADGSSGGRARCGRTGPHVRAR